MKKILAIILSLVTLLFIAIPAGAASANFKANFPLPATKTYSVTVLDRYSGGGEHSSYINQWVLGKSSAPRGIVMDIGGAAEGTDVYAVMSGKVITAKYFSAGGNAVVIKHDDGSYSYYGHLSSMSVKKGATVTTGQKVGSVGATGSAQGVHLHFEWSGHDAYSQYAALGLVKIARNSGASRYPHSHVHSYNSVGKCSCGGQYPLMVTPTSKSASVVKVNSSNTAPIHTTPYGDATITARLKKGASVQITGYCWNAYGNLWYQIRDNRGNTGYVVYDYLSVR